MKHYNQKGFTLVEILVAMTVFAIGVLGVITMQQATFGGNATSNALTGAASTAAAHLELLKGLAYDDPLLRDRNPATPTDPDPTLPNNYLGLDGLRSPLPPPSVWAGLASKVLEDIPDADTYVPDFEITSADGLYTVYWNIAEEFPIPDTKTIQVIVISTGHGPQKLVTLKTVKAETS